MSDIEKLVDELIVCGEVIAFDLDSGKDETDSRQKLSVARSALLSRIEDVRQEADAWHKVADEWKEDARNLYLASTTNNWAFTENEKKSLEAHSALTARYSHEKEGE